jgi:diguanylate cyclase (GGDEF)-like protein
MIPIDAPQTEPSAAEDAFGPEDLRKNEGRNGRRRILAYTWVLITVWTLVIVISLGWNLYQELQEDQDVALMTARINFEKDILFRRWASMHGGVYVPVTAATPPNLFLAHLPERDLTTPSGRKLTLMNPAYITRQMYTLSRKESAIGGHITSLKPLRPENQADPWEVQALKSFEQGQSEASTLVTLAGQPYLRFMRPLKTEKGCLNCHARQGYQEGDIRGGLSVSIPLAPIHAAHSRTALTISLGHGLLWLVGMAGIVLGRRRLITSWTQEEHAEEALRQSNERLQDLVEVTGRLNREISLVSELADHLHACMTGEEAQQIIHRMAPRLFPEQSGALLLLNASRNILELTVAWGETPPDQPVMDPRKCWALRRGRPYLMQEADQDLICEHLSPPLAAGYYCVPLVAQGETLGVLHLRAMAPAPGGVSRPAISESCQSLAITVAEHLALSLGNLKLQETLRLQAIRDPLTGLFNRRFMVETLERELYRMHRKGSSLAVIMMDIDHFKHFNDTFGHSAGDALLSALGRMMSSKVRKEDVACRYGGEEFTLILPEMSLETACNRAEELRQSVHGLHLEHHGQSLGTITISLGVAVFPQHGEDPEALLGAADAALYEAKHAGRDRVVAGKEANQAL